MDRPKITVVGASDVGASVYECAAERELGDVVEQVIEGKLTAEEQASFDKSAEAVRGLVGTFKS